MSGTVIRVESVSKRYRIGQRERYHTLRDVLARALTVPFNGSKRNSERDRRNATAEHIWALKDVSFEVREGEILGFVGRNGAGKSTILRILSRITRPTKGWADLRGRVGSLLEVGTGFHPELTGRENIYLNGAILGMKKGEISNKFDEIVAFAEVERFVDTAVKHYSSGMYVRLAFAVAAHLEPDILLVDEVLAVGDLGFQAKCMGKVGDVARGGRTVLFVSHQMNQIRRLCGRVIWLDGGCIREIGSAPEVVSSYERSMSSGYSSGSPERPDAPRVKARFVRWEIVEPRASQANVLGRQGPVTIKFVVQVNEPLPNVQHGIGLYDYERQLLWGTAVHRFRLDCGTQELIYKLPTLPLRPAAYNWRVTLFDEDRLVDDWECVPELLIATEPMTHWSDEWMGTLNIPCDFSVSRAQRTDEVS
jgi:lipopolysaccharide transport system ATP-binding protein